MLPGFLHRLLAEIRYLVEKPKYKKTLATKTFRIHTPPAKANCVAWLGGKNFFVCLFVCSGLTLQLAESYLPDRELNPDPQKCK